MSLLSIGNPKTMKGQKKGYLTGVLHLLPHKYSGYGNVCPDATKGCSSTCLAFAGRGAMNRTQEARRQKNRAFKEDRQLFLSDLYEDISALVRKAKRENLTPVVRLNGTSDIPWENLLGPWAGSIMTCFPTVQFYDYTKSFRRMMAFLLGRSPGEDWPKNYHLTFSRSEKNAADCQAVLGAKGTVAVVFDHLPEIGKNWTVQIPGIAGDWAVYSGEEDDLRFKEKGGVIALKAKGLARKDKSGFVLKSESCSWLRWEPIKKTKGRYEVVETINLGGAL